MNMFCFINVTTDIFPFTSSTCIMPTIKSIFYNLDIYFKISHVNNFVF